MSLSQRKNLKHLNPLLRIGSFSQHKLICLAAVGFIIAWLVLYFNAVDQKDWWIENILVILFLTVLFIVRQKFVFSKAALFFIITFMVLHLYGAQGAYTQNSFGEFLQERFTLARNPFDRIVHFSFGFLLIYPMREVFGKFSRDRPQAIWFFANMAILCLASIFELLEWGVAACTDKITGETYVATQGDPWDAQKDIILALIGSLLMSTSLIITATKRIKTAVV